MPPSGITSWGSGDFLRVNLARTRPASTGMKSSFALVSVLWILSAIASSSQTVPPLGWASRNSDPRRAGTSQARENPACSIRPGTKRAAARVGNNAVFGAISAQLAWSTAYVRPPDEVLAQLQAIAPCVVLGPSTIAEAHTPTEKVKLADLFAAVPTFTRLAEAMARGF